MCLQTEINPHSLKPHAIYQISKQTGSDYDSSSDRRGSTCKTQHFAVYWYHNGQKRNVPKLPFPFHLNWFPTIETNISWDIKLSSACVIPSSLNLFFLSWPFCVEAASSSCTISQLPSTCSQRSDLAHSPILPVAHWISSSKSTLSAASASPLVWILSALFSGETNKSKDTN